MNNGVNPNLYRVTAPVAACLLLMAWAGHVEGRDRGGEVSLVDTVEDYLPEAVRGDWSTLLGDSLPGMAVRNDELLVAWARPHAGSVEVRLLRDGVLWLAQSLPAPGAFGAPTVGGLDGGWFVGWTGQGKALRLHTLNDELVVRPSTDLGHGLVLGSAVVEGTLHLLSYDPSMGPAVWSVDADPATGGGLRTLSFPNLPCEIPLDRMAGLSELHLTGPGGAFATPDSPSWIDTPGRDCALQVISPPFPIDIYGRAAARGDHTCTMAQRVEHEAPSGGTLRRVFEREPCRLEGGNHVVLYWKLPGPDAHSISLELDGAGLVSGFDIHDSTPRECGNAQAASSVK